MTYTVFQVPLINPSKARVAKATGVADGTLVNTAIAAGNAALIVDEALIDLAFIKSGLVYVPAEECGNAFLEHTAEYTAQDPLQAAYAKCKHLNPKLTMLFAIVDPAVTTMLGVMTGGYDVAYLVNMLLPEERPIGFATVANEILADYLRESLP